ncbi:MAG: hypothetical protein TECD_01188 [Hyphomicrobiaceae bacterium hypho_1]
MSPSMETKKHFRAWQRMLTGRRLDLLNPSPSDIDIRDIAYGLSRVSRWNGQTIGAHPLSVAQHSIIVDEIFSVIKPASSRQERLMALLHDSPEYVIGDLISPFKAALGLDYKTIEIRLLRAIHVRFELPEDLPEEVGKKIKIADTIAAFYEATCLAGFEVTEANQIFELPVSIPQKIDFHLKSLEAYPTALAYKKFMERFSELTGENLL